jgi:hypothetical protein
MSKRGVGLLLILTGDQLAHRPDFQFDRLMATEQASASISIARPRLEHVLDLRSTDRAATSRLARCTRTGSIDDRADR